MTDVKNKSTPEEFDLSNYIKRVKQFYVVFLIDSVVMMLTYPLYIQLFTSS